MQPSQSVKKKNGRGGTGGMENERRGGGSEAIGAGWAVKYMFLHKCCVYILLSLRQTVGCIGEELEKKGSGVCVCV